MLRPFDGVSPYRLEMQAKLKADFCRNLYEFWGDSLGNILLQEDSVLVNLASEEYARAVRPWVKGKARFIPCVFAEEPEPGVFLEKGVYVKMARGEMVRFLAQNRARSLADVTAFERLGYRYVPGESAGDRLVFLREVPAKR